MSGCYLAAHQDVALPTLYCTEHGRWVVWQGCYCAQHYRPCPECITPGRSYSWEYES